MSTSTLARPLALVAVAAVLGTLGDQIHVQLGVLYYTHPVLLGQAFWVPLLFAAGGLPMGYGHAPLLRLFPTDERPARDRVVLPGMLFFAAYLVTGLFADWPRALALGLVAAWALRVLLLARGRRALEIVLAGVNLAIGGTLCEALVSRGGGFYYTHPDLLGVPVWLPALYLHLSLLTRHVYLAWLAPEARRAPAIARAA